jgi:hypothetical protein
MSVITLSVPAFAASGAVKQKEANKIAAARQEMTYDVYAGGFHVVSADLLIDLAKKTTYTLRLGAYTHGMLAKLAPWKGVFETKGWYDPKKAAPQPQMHSSDTTWRDEKEVVQFVYNKDGTFKEHRIFNDKKNGKQPPQPELSDKTTDVLSATLAVMNNVAETGKCEGNDKIFDGERSYNLIYHHQKETVLEKSDLNLYSGPAAECTVEVKPLKGRWHSRPRGWMSIQEQGREKGTMPTVWFAKMTPGQTPVPVRIRVKTDYGTLFMHLTGYNGGGKKLALDK